MLKLLDKENALVFGKTLKKMNMKINKKMNSLEKLSKYTLVIVLQSKETLTLN